MERIPDDHPVFHCYYDFDTYPLVPGTAAGAAWGGKYERDGAEYGHRAYGYFDDDGRLMMMINWNTDIGDGWEWAGTSSWGESYPRKYAEIAYKLGVNYAVYAMTH